MERGGTDVDRLSDVQETGGYEESRGSAKHWGNPPRKGGHGRATMRSRSGAEGEGGVKKTFLISEKEET